MLTHPEGALPLCFLASELWQELRQPLGLHKHPGEVGDERGGWGTQSLRQLLT